jgi:hypothetical protein
MFREQGKTMTNIPRDEFEAGSGPQDARPAWQIFRTRCIHPWHREFGYAGLQQEGRRRQAEDRERWLQIWPTATSVGEEDKWICEQCRRRDAKRLAQAQRRAAARRLGNPGWAKYAIPRPPKYRLAAWRFPHLQGQTYYANRVAPEGLRWCTWAAHYVSSADMGPRLSQQAPTMCQWCTTHYRHYRDSRQRARLRDRKTRDRQAVERLREQKVALQAETRRLRGLKAHLEQQILRLGAPHLPAAPPELEERGVSRAWQNGYPQQVRGYTEYAEGNE